MDVDFTGAGKCLGFRPTLKGACNANRQDRRAGSDGQAGETGPKLFYLAVGRAGTLGKNQEHLAALQAPERLLDAGDPKSFAVDGDGIDRSYKPAKGGEVEEGFAGQIIHVSPAGHADQGRI